MSTNDFAGMSKEDLIKALLADEKKKETVAKSSTECSFNCSLTSEGEIEFSWSTRPNKPCFTKEQIQKILSNFDKLEELLK